MPTSPVFIRQPSHRSTTYPIIILVQSILILILSFLFFFCFSFPLLTKIFLLLQEAMQRFPSTAKNLSRKILHYHHLINTPKPAVKPACDIFINHRGIDTKRTISGLLYNHLSRLGYNPFLDSKNMKPGDRLFDKINSAIKNCKLGVAVFSPRYCESYFCLHELALIMETKERVIPIFCDVKPSQLQVPDNGSRPIQELRRFEDALEQAKYTVGLTFDSHEGDWSEFLIMATDAIVKNLIELEEGGSSFKHPKNFVHKYC
ncbi:TIR-only protein [Ricinus communis]|uniref:TIR-only protein n=1 Tax=Ricinus communis TaxID=3988 RepID=UPI00201A3066|nr:TIR-only protein [Ricinus communis]